MDYPINRDTLAEFAATAEPTQAEMRRDLALAMGWTSITGDVGFAPDSVDDWRKMKTGIPNPFTDAADKDALVAWLATQSAEVWGNFSAAVIDSAIPFDQQAYADWEMVTRAVMTADRKTIAMAAWRAIQGEVK